MSVPGLHDICSLSWGVRGRRVEICIFFSGRRDGERRNVEGVTWWAGRCVRGSGRHRNAKGSFLIKLLNQRTGRKTHGEQPCFFPPLSSIQLFPVLSNKSHMTGKCCEPSGCDDLIRANIPTEFQQINSHVSRDSERKAERCSDKPPFRSYSELTFGLSEFIRPRLLTDSVLAQICGQISSP